MTDKKEKSQDILGDIKKIEKIRKAQMLSNALIELKEKAKQILILKRETNSLLKEIGLCETDRKKIIDYVNSTVKLSPSDKRKVRDDSQKTKDKLEVEVEKKIKDSPIQQAYTWFDNNVSNTTGSISNAMNMSYCSSSDRTGSYLGGLKTTNTMNDLSVSIGGMNLKM